MPHAVGANRWRAGHAFAGVLPCLLALHLEHCGPARLVWPLCANWGRSGSAPEATACAAAKYPQLRHNQRSARRAAMPPAGRLHDLRSLPNPGSDAPVTEARPPVTKRCETIQRLSPPLAVPPPARPAGWAPLRPRAMRQHRRRGVVQPPLAPAVAVARRATLRSHQDGSAGGLALCPASVHAPAIGSNAADASTAPKRPALPTRTLSAAPPWPASPAVAARDLAAAAARRARAVGHLLPHAGNAALSHHQQLAPRRGRLVVPRREAGPRLLLLLLLHVRTSMTAAVLTATPVGLRPAGSPPGPAAAWPAAWQ